MVLRILLVTGLLGALLALPGPVRGQEQQVGSCRVLPGTQRAVGRTVGGARVVYMSRPRLACEGGIRINADSLVSFEATGFNQLFGSVFFEDANRRLVSRNARYFDQVGRLEADGSVELTDKNSGNVVRGENLLYLRAIEPSRPMEELTVWGGRAHALLYPGGAFQADTLADSVQDRTPYDVTADRIFLRGDSYVQASGTVEVVRDSLNAFADTLRYDEAEERLLLTREARVEQARFDLSGREILLLLPGDTIRSVEARGEGRLVGEELDLEAPFIRMEFTAGQLDGLWATPLRPGQELEVILGRRVLPAELDSLDSRRPEARSTDFHIVADSLEVEAPQEVLERVYAVGSARAVSTGRDSLNTPETPDLVRQDWIIGDTVIAFFGEAPPEPGQDSVAYVLERLEARGQAASLYRLEPDSTGAPPVDGEEPGGEEPALSPQSPEQAAEEPVVLRRGPEPAIHYVTAGEIVIVFSEGQVERMEVKGLKQGIHLDPAGRARGVVAGREPAEP